MDETLKKAVVSATGIDSNKVEEIMKQWVLEQGRSPQSLGLEDLREVLVHILQDLFREVAEGRNPYISLLD